MSQKMNVMFDWEFSSKMNIKIISCIFLQLEDIWGTLRSWLVLPALPLGAVDSCEAVSSVVCGEIKTRPMMRLFLLSPASHYRYCRQHRPARPDWLEGVT